MRATTTLGAVACFVLSAATADAEVLRGRPATGGGGGPIEGWLGCRDRRPQPADCTALRSAAVKQLGEDVRALGTAGNFAPLPALLTVLARSPEPELRAAAADGLGMIGPRATETAALTRAFSDPVPAVRAAARNALGASADESAKALGGRAVRAERWTSLTPEPEPQVAKLKVPLYAGAKPLRFAADVAGGSAQLSTADPAAQVIAFYAAKSKRKPLTLDEFAAAFAAKPAEEETPEDEEGDSGAQMPSAEDFAQAMAMMQQMNEAMNSGKSAQEAAVEMAGAETDADSAASVYADGSIYGDPRVIVLEENETFGTRRPVRYVVVYADRTLGSTGIALHGPPVI